MLQIPFSLDGDYRWWWWRKGLLLWMLNSCNEKWFCCCKVCPAKRWKKYLGHHADLSNHSKACSTGYSYCQVCYFPIQSSHLASEKETLGLLFNILFSTTNGLSMNRGAPTHSCWFHSSFNEDYPIQIEDKMEDQSSLSTAASCSWGQLSNTHQSTYSTWEFVHALNAVTKADDVGKLQKASYFSLLLNKSNYITYAKNFMVLLSVFGCWQKNWSEVYEIGGFTISKIRNVFAKL